ncbi:hypothetical protein, partial [Pseudoalteromonas luteoviolacea]|uniref:hypothetical protein n=1 Tax=Pseudoalteromonas luteoviolacea TaxID=43657 RepID=UPI000AE9BF5C
GVSISSLILLSPQHLPIYAMHSKLAFVQGLDMLYQSHLNGSVCDETHLEHTPPLNTFVN